MLTNNVSNTTKPIIIIRPQPGYEFGGTKNYQNFEVLPQG